MYFISHAWDDNEVCDPIAKHFIDEFGSDNVFYDRWKNQPGESIIDRIDTGLEKTEIFFLFWSEAARSRAMVKREWHSALSRSIKGKLQFVLIRLDEIDPPAITDDLVYIDMFQRGWKAALDDMTNLCRNRTMFDISSSVDFSNLECSLIDQSSNHIMARISAKRFQEQQPFLACSIDSLSVSEFDMHPGQKEGLYRAGICRDRAEDDSVIWEMRYVQLPLRPISPSEPVILRITFSQPQQSVSASLFVKENMKFRSISPKGC